MLLVALLLLVLPQSVLCLISEVTCLKNHAAPRHLQVDAPSSCTGFLLFLWRTLRCLSSKWNRYSKLSSFPFLFSKMCDLWFSIRNERYLPTPVSKCVTFRKKNCEPLRFSLSSDSLKHQLLNHYFVRSSCKLASRMPLKLQKLEGRSYGKENDQCPTREFFFLNNHNVACLFLCGASSRRYTLGAWKKVRLAK